MTILRSQFYDDATRDQIAAINSLIEETVLLVLNSYTPALQRAKDNDSEVARIHLAMMNEAVVRVAPHRKLLTDILSVANMPHFVAMKERLDG